MFVAFFVVQFIAFCHVCYPGDVFVFLNYGFSDSLNDSYEKQTEII